jgi:phosphoribosylglycinamide formyltransferase-1
LKNIAVLVSGGGTNLAAIIRAQKSGKIKSGRISVVISSRADAYALKRAQKAGIETLVIERSAFHNASAFSKALSDALAKRDISLVVLAGFMSILSPEFVAEYENAIINVHPSLIPSFCGVGFYGLRVHEAALERGVKLSGATVHFVNSETDGGPIIMQKAVAVHETDTAVSLQKKIMKLCEHKILPEAIELFCAGKLEVNKGNVRIVK